MSTRARSVAALAGLFLATSAAGSCGPPEGLQVGDAELTWRELARAEEQLARSFPDEGRSTLRWHLLEFGMGPAAILHQQAPEESRAALRRAEAWAGRLRAGEPFAALRAEWAEEHGMPEPSELPRLPSPASLGGRAAAAVAALAPGEWAGPIRTARGWEIVHLVQRWPGPRNRANVVVHRMVFPVGTVEQRAEAQESWDTLPLSGNPEILDALPIEFRRGRLTESP